MPYYWKRGLIAGLVVGVMLHILLQQLTARTPMGSGNMQMDNPSAPAPVQTHHTPLGPLMGLTIFALCCVMPGPDFGKVGR